MSARNCACSSSVFCASTVIRLICKRGQPTRSWNRLRFSRLSGQRSRRTSRRSPMLPPHKIPQSVLVVIHTSKLDVLLINRADAPNYWQSVTGAKDFEDEPLEATARREVMEET